MFIIWGSKYLSKTVGSGVFYCPQCDDTGRDYAEKAFREWFTLYWIPVFPIGGPKPVIECESCGGQFQPDVLEMEPPSESERFTNKLFRSLEAGMPLSKAKAKLGELGMDANAANGWIETFTKDQSWECPQCRESYVDAVKKCPECKTKKPRV